MNLYNLRKIVCGMEDGWLTPDKKTVKIVAKIGGLRDFDANPNEYMKKYKELESKANERI